MYEPLLIGICFPFIRSAPGQLRGTPKMFSVARSVRGMSKDADMDERDFLRKFCRDCWNMATVPEDVEEPKGPSTVAEDVEEHKESEPGTEEEPKSSA